MMLPLRDKNGRRRQALSTKNGTKRKAAITTLDPRSNSVTNSKKLFKTSEGISICSEIVTHHIKNNSKPTKKEMVAIQQTLDYSAANGMAFAKVQCPAGGDPSWLAARDKREALEQELENLVNLDPPKSSRKKTKAAALLDTLLKFTEENIKENVSPPQSQQRPKRSKSSKRDRYSPSENVEPLPSPKNGEMFECLEAMKHLEGRCRDGLVKYWIQMGWIPVSRSHCGKLWQQYVKYKNGEGDLPTWKVITGRPQLATTEEFMDACKAKERDRHMVLTKDDIRLVLVELSEKRARENNKWKSEDDHEPAKDNYCEQLKHRMEDHFRQSSICSVENRKLKLVLDLLACLPSILTKVHFKLVEILLQNTQVI